MNYKQTWNRNKKKDSVHILQLSLTYLYFLCLCSLLYYCRLSFAKCCLAFVFSLLALHAWLAALEPLSRRDLGLF